jgi:hypothetical protein
MNNLSGKEGRKCKECLELVSGNVKNLKNPPFSRLISSFFVLLCPDAISNRESTGNRNSYRGEKNFPFIEVGNYILLRDAGKLLKNAVEFIRMYEKP